MTLLNRDALLKKEELEKVKVDLGKGGYVYVRQMTGRERDKFEQSLVFEGKDGTYTKSLDDFRAKLAACTVCDAEGNLILNMNDAPTLSQNMSAARLEKIINEAQKLNKISDEDKENLIKNSEGDPVASSPSDSAEN